MDLSELRSTTGQGAGRPAFDACTAIAEIGIEVAGTLSLALERVDEAAAGGVEGAVALRTLRAEIDAARRVGIAAQQIARLAAGRVGTQPERLDLTSMLRDALVQRRREIESRGLEVRQVLQHAEVIADPALLFALLNTVFDWAAAHTVSRIDFTIELRPWPPNARLQCSFAYRPADEVDSGPMPLDTAPPALDGVSWRLLELTARVLGLSVDRRDNACRTQLSLEFPRTVGDRLEGLSSHELDDPAQLGANSRPLAGSHLLVIAPRREVRNLVREATRAMGLMIDYVTSIDAAQEFCRGSLPHGIVYEGLLDTDRFEALRGEVLAAAPGIAFVEIAEHGKAFAVHNSGGHPFVSVGRDALLGSLPAALMFELARLR